MASTVKDDIVCKKCETPFTPKGRGRVNCYTCVPESSIDARDEGFAPPIACSTCEHAIACKAAYDGYACGRERFRYCRPYNEKRLYEKGTPHPAGSAYRAPTRQAVAHA